MALINQTLSIPLVLHGGSGIPDDKIQKAIECGTSKINVNTELQDAWTHALRQFLKEDEKAYDPRKVIGSGEKALKDKVEEKQRSATVQVEDTVVNGEVKSQVKRYTVTDRPFDFHYIIAEGTLTTTSFVQVQPTLVRLPLAAASKDNRFTLASKQAPISGLKILASDQNFDRAVKISADRQLIASSHISAINLPGKKSDNRAVMFRETRAENLEVEIDSNGHSPLNIDPDHPADAYMDSYFVCFIAEPGASYELQTCNPYATGKVKYERLIEQYLNEGHCAVQGELAPATGITFAPRPWSMPNFWSRNGITAISLVIMAILAAACFSIFKKFGAVQNND